MLKRLMAAVLTVLRVFGLFSCQNVKDTGADDAISDQAELSKFLVSDLDDYCIVYADGLSMDAFKKIRNLQNLLEEKFGVKPDSAGKVKSEQEKEILIGKTNRSAENEIFAQAPKVDDYAIGTVDKKLVIAAHNDQMIMTALDALIDALNGLSSDSKVFFEPSMCKIVTGEYPMNTILLGDYDIKNYTVVYEDSEAGTVLAEQVRNIILNKCGYLLELSTTPVEGNMILVGKTAKGVPSGMTDASKDFYYMGIEDRDLYLYGAELPAAYESVESFCELVASAMGDTAVLNVDRGTVEAVDYSMVAMSFNLQCNITDVARVDHVLSTIKKHMPDTFGVQEATAQWMEYLNDVLKDLYAYVGEGRDPSGSNEYNAVFYRKDQFDLIASGTKWLSDTPDVVGSKLSGSAYPRIFTYAVLKMKSTGEEFIHVNTHTDHLGDGDQVRFKQMQVMVEFLKNNYPNMPTIVTGDMNEVVSKPSLSYLRASGFDNSAEIAIVGDDAPTFRELVIDFLWVSQGDFLVYQYDVDTTLYDGKYASDHRAIIMQYQFLN